ncbi:MAG: hypothetical protein WAQ75_03410, partial [Propionicimonas sp.]
MTSPTTSTSEQEASPLGPRRFDVGRWARRSLAPVILAVALFLGIWQAVVLTGWRPDYLLPGPATVLAALGEISAAGEFWQALGRTLLRALTG